MTKNTLSSAIGIATFIIISVVSGGGAYSEDKLTVQQQISQLVVDEAVTKWRANPYPLLDGFAPYKTDGAYLHYSRSRICEPREGVLATDDTGVVMSLRDGTPYYHPVLLAQCGLNSVSRYDAGKDKTFDNAILYAKKLIELETDSGALPYQFPFKLSSVGDVLQPGWTSGMAQGQAISLFSRLWRLTGDQSYLDAGRKAFHHLTSWEKDGGNMVTLEQLNPDWSDRIFFEEYSTNPNSYTLNGYMFALLGVYDWSKTSLPKDEAHLAENFFRQGIESLKLILPLYDLEKISAYDLSHITLRGRPPHINPQYHGVHIELLDAIYSITHDGIFKQYEDRWRSYVVSN